jgi:hypothetical protein
LLPVLLIGILYFGFIPPAIREVELEEGEHPCHVTVVYNDGHSIHKCWILGKTRANVIMFTLEREKAHRRHHRQ